jgi:hypothetical protein
VKNNITPTPVDQATRKKTRGANIFCAVCHAEPFPDDPGVRETFELCRYGPDGQVAESPRPGQWRCSQHIPKRRPNTAVKATS